MTDEVKVTVQGITGDVIEQEMQLSATVGELRATVSESWSLHPKAFHFISGESILDDEVEISSLVPGGGGEIMVQLTQFEPHLDLGKWNTSHHQGIKLDNADNGILIKTSGFPDSNNVFVCEDIRYPCFAEFKLHGVKDEMSIGVTYDEKTVEKISGFSNCHLKTTWIYSRRKSMPILCFGGKNLNPDGVGGFVEGDRVAVYVDPQKRTVKFYKNGEFAYSNMPDYPLPAFGENPLKLYCMVDGVNDKIEIIRFGPGDAY